jgi:hypothetical protein
VKLGLRKLRHRYGRAGVGTLIVGKWYVVDRFGHGRGAVMSGPFDTKVEAERDRRAMNIADDCFLYKAKGR